MELACDVLVVGGGCGGVAAALAATDLGRVVILTEVSGWLGGQLTSQAVPPDEHPWVESTGITARYRQLREAVRTRYKQTRRLTKMATRDPYLNPGGAWVSKLSAEPQVFRKVIDDILRPAQAEGLLRCLVRHQPEDVAMEHDQIAAVRFRDLQTGDQLTITPRYVLEATEEGDLLPLAGCESLVGAESAATPPSSLFWKLMSGLRHVHAQIGLSLSRTASVSAVTESICIRAQQDVDISTSRPIRSKSHWER